MNVLHHAETEEVSEYKKFASSTKQAKETVPPLVISVYSFRDDIAAVIPFFKPIGTPVFCRYFDSLGEEIKPPVKSAVYPLFVVYCKQRNAEKLTISDSSNSIIHSHFKAPIKTFEKNKNLLTHCVAPVFGDEPKWLQLAEMVEHYKLQGVAKFIFYVRQTSFYDSLLLEHYRRQGLIEIVQMPAVLLDVVSQQLMAIADCHLRSKQEARWTIYSDIDERLIMSDENETIANFLENLQNESVGSVLFQQRWILKRKRFPEKFENDKQVIQSMPTMAWHETTATATGCSNQANCWGKQIVNNQKVNRVLVHDIADFEPGSHQMNLNASRGYIRHYRDASMENWERETLKNMKFSGPITNTSYPEKLGEELISNVLKVLHEVYVNK